MFVRQEEIELLYRELLDAIAHAPHLPANMSQAILSADMVKLEMSRGKIHFIYQNGGMQSSLSVHKNAAAAAFERDFPLQTPSQSGKGYGGYNGWNSRDSGMGAITDDPLLGCVVKIAEQCGWERTNAGPHIQRVFALLERLRQVHEAIPRPPEAGGIEQQILQLVKHYWGGEPDSYPARLQQMFDTALGLGITEFGSLFESWVERQGVQRSNNETLLAFFVTSIMEHAIPGQQQPQEESDVERTLRLGRTTAWSRVFWALSYPPI